MRVPFAKGVPLIRTPSFHGAKRAFRNHGIPLPSVLFRDHSLSPRAAFTTPKKKRRRAWVRRRSGPDQGFRRRVERKSVACRRSEGSGTASCFSYIDHSFVELMRHPRVAYFPSQAVVITRSPPSAT